MKNKNVTVSLVLVLLVSLTVQAADIVNSCDATTEFTFAEGGITVGGGNPSGDCVYFVPRSTNNHAFSWDITPNVVTGDKFYFDVKNAMVYGNATLHCYIVYNGGISYETYTNGLNHLSNGKAVIDSEGWKSCYVSMPIFAPIKVDYIRFYVEENTKIVSFDNFRLTQQCPESTTISIKNITAGTPTSTELYAAQQLQAAFQSSMHVTPLINPATEKTIKIRLGLASQFSPGVGNSSEQAYVIRKPSAGLFELVGNSEPAVLWAADAFCDKVLNIGWSVADNVADVNGTPADLNSVTLNQIGVPDFERRGWLIGYGIDGAFYDNKIINFMAHNRNSMMVESACYLDSTVPSLNNISVYDAAIMHGLDPDSGLGHSFWWLVPDADYYAIHPEYFPLIGGVRVHGSTNGIGNQLCISNYDVRNIVIQKAKDTLDAHPDLNVFGIVPNDGQGGWCQCTNCLAMDDGNDPIVNPCDTLYAFILPIYTTGYSQEGCITTGGNPDNCVEIVTRTYNNHHLTWNISPDVIQGDRLSFNVKNEMVYGNATLTCWIFHDGNPTPAGPSITGLTNGHVIDSSGWKSCYVDITEGINHIDSIVFVINENTKILYFDNFQLTQNAEDQTGTGKYSNRLIRFCNDIADELEPNYPGFKIGTLAYSEFVYPPSVNVSNNVQVFYCAGGRNYMKKLTDPCDADNASIMARINGWLSRASNVGLYEYYYFCGMAFCQTPFARTLCEEYPELKALGIKGIVSETTTDAISDTHWSRSSPFPYAAARSTWDTSLSFDEILADYCSKRYGPAASSMVSYHTLYETTIYNSVSVFPMFGPAAQLFPPAFTTATLNTLDGYLTSAATTAATSGTAANVAAVASDRTMFNLFKRMKDDPYTTVPGIGANLVTNPGAESDSTGWGFDIRDGNYAGTISTSNPHSGTKSFMITCTGTPGQSRWYQPVSCSVVPGRKYAARFWICAGSDASGEIWLYQSGTNMGRINITDSNNQWVQVVTPEFVADGNAVRIYINSFGTGTIQMDDCFLAVLPLPVAASTPSPATGATGLSITPTLSWTVGSYTISHDVYFGTNQSSVTYATHTAGEFRGNHASTTYAPGTLAANTTYYWRIDEVGNGGITTGTVWSFTTAAAPGQATTPNPANSATGVSITADLSWSAGSGTNSHNVYFGTDSTPDETEYKGNQAGTTYDLGTLTASTTYYWRIDEVGNGGTTTGIVWSFTTNANSVPTFVAAGAVTSNTTAITPALPASIATGDILLLFLETANEAITIPTPNGGTWTAVTNSPQGTGTAASTSATRLTVFWSRYNGTQGAPTTSDSGEHQAGRIIAIRGAANIGNPWDVIAGGVEATADTSGSIPGATTTATNTLVVIAIATSLPDSTSTTRFSAWTNANLTSITERTDNSVTAGNGGGLGVATGIKATAGAYGNTAVTLATSAYKGMMSIAIKP